MDFSNFQVTLEEVLEQFNENERDFYEDIIDELLDNVNEHFHPTATWKELTVTPQDANTLSLNDTVFTGEYLPSKLEGVKMVYGFLVTVGEEVWKQRDTTSDALELMLFDSILNTCMNKIFGKLASEIVNLLPSDMEVFMENPGQIDGWQVEDQEKLLSLLYENEADILNLMDDKHLFKTNHSLAGIIYAKGKRTNDAWYQDEKSLVQHLHESSDVK